jgi:hypothetical protein
MIKEKRKHVALSKQERDNALLLLLWNYLRHEGELSDKVITGSGVKTRSGLTAAIDEIYEEHAIQAQAKKLHGLLAHAVIRLEALGESRTEIEVLQEALKSHEKGIDPVKKAGVLPRFNGAKDGSSEKVKL